MNIMHYYAPLGARPGPPHRAEERGAGVPAAHQFPRGGAHPRAGHGQAQPQRTGGGGGAIQRAEEGTISVLYILFICTIYVLYVLYMYYICTIMVIYTIYATY
jgi:hypothetical protein